MFNPTLITDYGTENRLHDALVFVKQRVFEGRSCAADEGSLIVCKESENYRTVARHNNGLSKEEVRRLCDSIEFMSRTTLPLYWAVLGDDALDMSSGDARKEFGRFKSQLGQTQKRKGYPAYYTEVLEAQGGLHSNLVFIGDEKLALSLLRSFPSLMRSGYGQGNAMQCVYDISYLTRRYLAKERTTQANYALGWNQQTRARGSHRIEGGGDRVRLSKALEADAIAAGAVEPWKKTNARRLS